MNSLLKKNLQNWLEFSGMGELTGLLDQELSWEDYKMAISEKILEKDEQYQLILSKINPDIAINEKYRNLASKIIDIQKQKILMKPQNRNLLNEIKKAAISF